MAILVTGGAGYFGSMTVELLAIKGERVMVLDKLARGHREALDSRIPFYDFNWHRFAVCASNLCSAGVLLSVGSLERGEIRCWSSASRN